MPNSQPVLGPGQPFLLQATAFDPDALPLPMQFLWTQSSGPDTALFNDVSLLEPTVICSSLGDYVFRLSATDGVAIVSQEITVHITNVYRAAASFTAYCGSGSNGLPVTIVANYASAISPDDANAEALALATAQAYAALQCVPNIAPNVAVIGLTPTVSAVTTYTAACVPPDVGTPVTVTYTFTDVGRAYPAVESSSLTVASAQANKALSCTRGNIPPVVRLIGFDFAVAATATATARCQDITAIAYGPPVSIPATVALNNTTYEEAERTAYLTARARALASLVCASNVPPTVTITGWTATVTAFVTVVSVCPFGQKGTPVVLVKSFSANDYSVAEVTALTAGYAQGGAQLVCTNNIPPEVFIVTASDLVYRCGVPYRNTNFYRSANSVNQDFTYIASSTGIARCSPGTYGPGAYAAASASSFISYSDAEAKAIIAAGAAAQALLKCTPYTNRIALRTYNANAKYAPGDSQCLGVFRLTSGTPAAPLRLRFLGVYTVPLAGTFQNRFTDNLFYLSQFNDVYSGNWNYIFYLGRPHADGSYVWIPDSVRLRLDGGYPAAASIVSLSPSPTSGILSAAEGVLSVSGLESLTFVNLSLAAAPYLSIDVAGWSELGASYNGVYVLQTDSAISQVLASGLFPLAAFSPDSATEKTVVPLPFVPVFTSHLTPLTFLFYFASANSGAPLGYNLNAGWPVGPPGASAPFLTDTSAVAWTNAGTNNLPPYAVSSLASPKTVALGTGTVTLPAATSHVATFAGTHDAKLILRRYRQRLF
jgi:hypothetical protein